MALMYDNKLAQVCLVVKRVFCLYLRCCHLPHSVFQFEYLYKEQLSHVERVSAFRLEFLSKLCPENVRFGKFLC